MVRGELSNVVIDPPGSRGELCPDVEAIDRLGQGDKLDGHDLKDVFDDLFAQKGRVGSHTDDILIVIVVGDAVDVVGHGQRV